VRTHLPALSPLLFLALVGCGGSVQVGSLVELPPELPVRVFPEVAVVPGTAPEDLDVADALARHLAAGAFGGLEDARVVRLDDLGLERRRERGSFGPASAVIHVRTRVIESVRPTLFTRPETVCTAWGCSTIRRTVVEDFPVVMGRVVLRVTEGRSGRLLQELALEEREEGADTLSMRLRVVERLRRRVLGAVDPGQRQVGIELLDVDDPEVRAALEAVRAGHPSEARTRLERLVAREGFAQQPPELRARVLFDLGQVRRLDAREASEELQESVLARAEEELRESLRLHPAPEYARALSQLSEERAARARMRAHRAAASHNFALDRTPALPAPPPGYEDALPPSPP
jgi:hypothetical protein